MFFEKIKIQFEKILQGLGDLVRFAGQFFRWVGLPPFRFSLIINQMNFIGINSLPIIFLVSFFSGAVFALQTGNAFRIFHAEIMVGSTVGLSLTREIAPVFTALMVIARMGSSMAAELGSMRVSEQIDALETMAINPYHFLVVPRVLATTVMLPFLTVVFNIVGFLGAYLVGVKLMSIPEGPFIEKTEYFVDADDLYGGLIKAVIFGFLLAVISCYQGYHTKNGATGVGVSTTKAVVMSSVTILIVDYFLTQWLLKIF